MQNCPPGKRLSPVSLLLAAIFLAAVAAAIYGAYLLGLNDSSRQPPGSRPAITILPPAETSVAPTLHPAGPVSLLGPHTVADVAEAVSPSVVNIDVFARQLASANGAESEFFFNGNRMTPLNTVPLAPRLQKNGTGSGVIIRADGYVLTNNHVVKGDDRIKVTLSDHRTFVGKIVGRDPLSDLAVVQIPALRLPVARLGSSKGLRPGDWAIAIGSPLGLDQTVTLGIISAIGRSVADVNSEVSFIQTDAAINPGNSGGPLLNLQGEVIGINSFVRSDAQNIGFATPIDQAQAVSDELIAKGKVDRSWVGIKLANLSPEARRRLNIGAGALVASVVENSPAAKAGVLPLDLIEKIDGQPVNSTKDVQRLIRTRRPGQKLTLQLRRKSQTMVVEIMLDDMPEDLD